MESAAPVQEVDLEGSGEPLTEEEMTEATSEYDAERDDPDSGIPANGEGEEPDASVAGDRESELQIEGTNTQLSFSIGGKKPTSSSLRLVGGKLDIEGQFAKGEIVTLLIEAQVGEVAFVDKRDSDTGDVVATERRHRARVIGVARG